MSVSPEQPDHPTAPVPPSEPAYNGEGVDLTLVRWMLSLTPEERLDYLDRQVSFFREAREHVRQQLER